MVISAKGIEAYLRNVENPMEEVQTLFRTEWNSEDADLLEKIENAIYDHPQLLDDFATDIAIETSKALWAPEPVIEGEDDPACKIFTTVFAANEEDIMRDYLDGKVCLYTLVPGLQAFLQRTFAGARVRCHQSVLVKRFENRQADMPRIYVDLRKGEADFIAFDGKRLLMAVTHEWHAVEDVRYHIFNLLDIYGLNPAETQVSVSGLREPKGELIQSLREEVAYVMMTMVPGIASKTGMSLAASLLMRGEG